ncbi:hypothetical protein VTG60DRAFT_5332 [Thermothelomyces hinnuleus]
MVGARLMTLMASARSPPAPAVASRLGVPYPLALGVKPSRGALVEKVPRDPSGKDRVEMSMDDTAVVGLAWAGATCAGPSLEGFRRGGRGGGDGEGDGEVTSEEPPFLVLASASRAIVDTPLCGPTRALSCDGPRGNEREDVSGLLLWSSWMVFIMPCCRSPKKKKEKIGEKAIYGGTLTGRSAEVCCAGSNPPKVHSWVVN